MLCGLKWKTCACPWFNYDAIEDDRLAHMRVPGAVPAAAPAPIQAPIPAPRIRPRIRRRNPDELARHMQGLDLNAAPAPAPAPVADYNYGFGVGNGAPHLMNETYLRPVPQARPPVNGLYVPRGAYNAPAAGVAAAPEPIGGGDGAAREERRRRRRERVAAPRPSVMAGLGGQGRGSGRVGAWRTHVGLGVTPEEGLISVV
jgi:hypothetical protein